MNNFINWDTTIYLSDKKYSSSEISTTTKGVLNIEKGIIEDLKLTAKEWIIYELKKCKEALESNKAKISSKKEIQKKLRELKLLNRYFGKHITTFDIVFSIHEIGDENYNKSIDNAYNEIKELIKTKQKKQEDILNNIENEQTAIKRICLENIKLILQKENVANYLNMADTLLRMNDIILGKNHKQTIYITDEYSQNNLELSIKKLHK